MVTSTTSLLSAFAVAMTAVLKSRRDAAEDEPTRCPRAQKTCPNLGASVQVEQHELAANCGKLVIKRGNDGARADGKVDDGLKGQDRRQNPSAVPGARRVIFRRSALVKR